MNCYKACSLYVTVVLLGHLNVLECFVTVAAVLHHVNCLSALCQVTIAKLEHDVSQLQYLLSLPQHPANNSAFSWCSCQLRLTSAWLAQVLRQQRLADHCSRLNWLAQSKGSKLCANFSKADPWALLYTYSTQTETPCCTAASTVQSTSELPLQSLNGC